MHELRTEIEISATAARVWSLLSDFASYKHWNPFIRSAAGAAAPGARLAIEIEPPGAKPMRFQPLVLCAAAERELRWRGRLLLPGLFDGEHYFLITPVAQRRVRLEHGEKFSGLLVPFLRGSLEGATRAGFIAMNEALKRRAESLV
jgi:hypothetical protein